MIMSFFLSGNAYSKVKLQCQGLVEIVEKNIIHVNFDEKYIDILQGSGGNKVSFEVRTIDETHVLSWDRPLEKDAKQVIQSGEFVTYDTHISNWNEWYSADLKDRLWVVYIDRLQGLVGVGHSKVSYKKRNKQSKKNRKKNIDIDWVLKWECKKYGFSDSKF